MNKTLPMTPRTVPQEPETSDDKVWRSPGYRIVETALEVTAYALADRRAPEPPQAS
ncbi:MULTISPECIES: pyrroloquinoline quinone precursor peptide PqqA [unclassified Streptomyces]|uniref:pyrroloquinoline quinone precursor peptide PqqA n=1 Tax=unclassified Streptomyces TaxID=2593676 RepID=UPI0011A6CC8C|nr:pyrroloquinoline quinone precursor peptide PqqA [Streptomyces sp. BK340]TVZ81804.1 coenzyme PQQ precursor peptide PqqA [Streptomyces sp. BK340]